MIKERIIFFLILLPLIALFGQKTNIKGVVVDTKSSQPVSFASIVLQKAFDNQIIDYTQTNEKGVFYLKKPLQKGVYKIVSRHLSYHTKTLTVIINEDSKTAFITIKMEENTTKLDEVTVKATQPIIVKKDTIIYDVKQFAKQKQQTLEEVLGDMDGIKILPNGEIEVKGKQVRKVLIDGKEVLDVGASVLTKSIDAKDVKKIEVRFDEKDNRLKESLLDTKKYVVLDIKLKKNVNTNFFGKLRATTGYNNSLKLGYYTNIFSLKEKRRIHLFSEYDAFGVQTISLRNIRNIGKESMVKIFEIPADFESLTQKENYKSEIFDFDDFIKYNRGVIGLSFLKKLTPKWSLFFGTYNSIFENLKEEQIHQKFSNSEELSFNNLRGIDDFSSKNKLEFKYNSDNTKITINSNLVYNKNDFADKTALLVNNLYHNFNKNNKNINLYNNFIWEYKFSKKLGFEVKANNSYIKRDENYYLNYNNPNYTTVFVNDAKQPVFNVHQLLDKNNLNNTVKAGLQKLSKIGVLRTGGVFEYRKLNFFANEKQVQSFSQPVTSYNYNSQKVFLEHLFEFNNVSLQNKAEFGSIYFPDFNNTNSKKKFINYEVNASFSPSNSFSIAGSYQNRLSSFPLLKLTKANSLVSFNIIETKAKQKITPKKERVISLALHKRFRELNLETDFGFISGKVYNQNNYFSNNSFVFSERNQLEGNYQAFSFIFTKRFKKLPLRITLEPEAVFNDNKNTINDKLYKTETKRWLLGLKINSNTKKKKVNFSAYTKYSKFDFYNSNTKLSSDLKFLSLSLLSDYVLLKNKLFLDLGARKVHFFDKETSNFFDVSLKLSMKYKKFYAFLSVYNLMNNKNIIQNEIQSVYFIAQQNKLFPRYFKIGLEYKF